MAFTIATANKILDKILRNVDFTPSAALYISLHTADPGESGTSEVTGGTYGRQVCTFNAAAAKSSANAGVLNFTLMPIATVTHFGVWSAASAGTFWWGGVINPNKTTAAGDTLQVAAGALTTPLT